MKTYEKVTRLEGYYATGDFECFCFDRVSTPHGDDREGEEMEKDRVYPDILLPDETRNSANKPVRGTFDIIIRFTPEEREKLWL